MNQHQYYVFDRKQLMTNPKIPLVVMENNETVFRAMAQEMTDEILRKNSIGEQTVLIVPVGPVGQYSYFVRMVNEQRISLKNTWFINMDEYLDDDKNWISSAHRLSFRGFMNRAVYSQIASELIMPEKQRVFPNPKDVEAISGLIEALGGVDICFGGIGINGHVAFNEPDSSMSNDGFLNQKTRMLTISQETRAINSVGDLNGALEDMPSYCITVGMKEISEARKIRLGCFRDWHRAVVRRAAHGIQSAAFPVSLLQSHEDISIRITEYVADLP